MAKFGVENLASVKDVSRETKERLTIYYDLLQKWQKSINLVATSTLQDAWTRHFEDSLQTYTHLRSPKSVVDLGSGAGFPGLVTAIMMLENDGGRVDLIESVGKKCAFMKAVVRETGLSNSSVQVKIWNDRIESVLPNLPPSEYVTARALADLDALFDLAKIPLTGGATGLFSKGRDHLAEIQKAQKRWKFKVETINSELEEGSVLLRVTELKPLAIN